MSSYDTNDLIDEGNKSLIGKGYQYKTIAPVLIILSLFFTLAYSLFWLNEEELQSQVASEIHLSQQSLVDSQYRTAIERTNSSYQSMFIESGIVGYLETQIYRQIDSSYSVALAKVTNVTNAFVTNFKLLSYRALFRANFVWEWFVLGGVAWFIFAMDAFYNYKIRLAVFEIQNIKMSGVMLNSIALSIFLFIIYLIIPMVSVAYWHYVPLMFILVMILTTSSLIRHYTRV
ncbi:DUF4400 domain-containing protein (plasmid) [Vibrio sp. SS-MA-C1-2]|uniref:DUF4400 domain-containing protein n=1 Tax=Vibrio sp. SS-MA-C1-2 TaxID=2908646 RepID=UPI001F1C32BB|nr:DUF4400 domain-containing protein [Vibrio sp. SS-MA-C1-2]UJF20200.1 DUF4400 domain-containing protein [Vibrio sp. SS-MA-C1-2]